MISDANRLEAEAKYLQAFSFRPLCKLLFASNHPLRLKEYDAAFVNRVVYIPFLHPIPKEKQGRHILEKMQNELPALFNHAFKAYKRLVANGYTLRGQTDSSPNGTAGIYINKELKRCDKSSLDELNRRGRSTVLFMFPDLKQGAKTSLVLKEPKTASSVRTVFLPGTVASALREMNVTQGIG